MSTEAGVNFPNSIAPPLPFSSICSREKGRSGGVANKLRMTRFLRVDHVRPDLVSTACTVAELGISSVRERGDFESGSRWLALDVYNARFPPGGLRSNHRIIRDEQREHAYATEKPKHSLSTILERFRMSVNS